MIVLYVLGYLNRNKQNSYAALRRQNYWKKYLHSSKQIIVEYYIREEKIMHKWARAVHKGWESGEASSQSEETPWLAKSLISFNENAMFLQQW